MDNVDGYITIGTKVDTTGLEKGIKDIERKNDTEIDVNVDEKTSKETTKTIEKTISAMTSEGSKATKVTKVLSIFASKGAGALSTMAGEVAATVSSIATIAVVVVAIAAVIVMIVAGVITIAKAVANVIFKTIKALLGIVNNLIKGIIDITKQTIDWGLKTFHIESAYNRIKSMIDDIIFDNDTINNQMKMLKGGLENLLEPAVQRIVNLVATLIRFFGDLIQLLLGKDIFANISDKLKSGAGSAKEIKKQLAGFDEMNVLTEPSSGGGGSGASASTDLGQVNQKLLDLLNKVRDLLLNGDWDVVAKMISTALVDGFNWAIEKIKSIPWATIGEYISKFITNIDYSGILTGLISLYGEIVLGIQDLLLSIDFGTFFDKLTKGVADAIGQISVYINKINWEGIAQKITDIFTSINWGELVFSIISVINQILFSLVRLITEIDWQEIGATLMENLMTLVNSIDWGQLVMDIFVIIGAFVLVGLDLLEGMLGKWVGTISEGFKQWIGGILRDFDDFVWKIINAVIDTITKIINKVVEISTFIKNIINLGITLFAAFVQYIYLKAKETVANIVNTIKEKIEKIITTISDTIKNIKTTISNTVQWIKDKFNSIVDFFGRIGVTIGDTFSGAIKGAVNTAFAWIEEKVNWFIRKINSVIEGVNKIGIFGSISKLSEISLPRLATGAIINQPGRGVPVGNAIAGEAGREGILPLTDERAMALLGKEIGKWITINAQIPVSIGNRQIAREIRKLMAEDDFAMNN